MGTFGAGPFDNDYAADFLIALERKDAGDLTPVATALRDGLADHSDSMDEAVAIGAAEVVAALLGHPHPGLPEVVAGWIAAGSLGDGALVTLAIDVVAQIRERSELLEMWAEFSPAKLPLWEASLSDLLSRLKLPT